MASSGESIPILVQHGDSLRKKAGKLKAGQEAEKLELYHHALEKYDYVLEQNPDTVLAHYGAN